jgi:hypothetical protein
MSTHASTMRYVGLVALTVGAAALGAAPKSFPTPEAAVDALIAAGRASDRSKILAVLGSDAKSLVSSGDPVADHATRQQFIEDYDQGHALVADGENKRTLVTGPDQWPFPIPLLKGKSGWSFDTKAGKQEILARRVGRNELDAIQVCLAYVDAQREYHDRNPEVASPSVYAKLLVSTQGKKDGLYWPVGPGEPESPFGPRVGGVAKEEGYHHQAGKSEPYHGYHYRILTSQGPHAPGGAANYLVDGKLYGGFGLVAWPATYGNSGIMTFEVNHAGVVFQKDLGPSTASAVKSIKSFDPDSTWSKAEAPAAKP